MVIAIIGGGVFVAKLCQILATHPDLPPGEIRLMARRFDRLCVIAAACQRIVDGIAPGWTVRAAPSVTAGCAGARVIVVLLRVGGLAARAHDEAFPRAFGLTGDEGLGAGGMANALRTLPTVHAVADSIARVAPEAMVFNMVAPLGVTTRAMLDAGLRVLGVCELPALTEARLLAAGRLSRGEVQYAGFNHWGWFWINGPAQKELARSSVDAGLADASTVATFGAVPLRYFYEIFAPETARKLGMRRSPQRAEELIALSDRVFRSFQRGSHGALATIEERPTPWFDQALAPMIAAVMTGASHEGFANLRNGGHLPMVPEDAVIEIRVRIRGDRVDAIMPEQPPDAVSSFLAAVGSSEEMVYRAAATLQDDERTQRIAVAMRALPLPGLTGDSDSLAAEIVKASQGGTAE
jgi:6-phospho-beta-glucosidase